MKTSELTGAALDWAVAKCEGLRVELNYQYTEEKFFKGWWQCGPHHWQPLQTVSTDWAHGGPIIEREEISIAKVGRSLDDAMAPHPECWCAHKDGVYSRYSETPLVAAMRCYVASKLGDEVEIPKELTA